MRRHEGQESKTAVWRFGGIRRHLRLGFWPEFLSRSSKNGSRQRAETGVVPLTPREALLSAKEAQDAYAAVKAV
jgi:hypothetical protein